MAELDDALSGYIKLYRCLLKKPAWKLSTPAQKVILITLLLMANHNENEWMWQGQKFKCLPGQMVTSLEEICKRAGKGISIQSVRGALLKFAKLEFLTNESTKTGRLITILNWELYQDELLKPTKQPTESQQSTNKEATTNKNDKNDKNSSSYKDAEEIYKLHPRYDEKQIQTIRDYWEVIKFTRKTGKVALSIIATEMDYWEQFTADIVVESLQTHIDKYQSKPEEYTRGIMRGKKKELENGRASGNPQPNNRESQSELDRIDFGKFEFKG